MDGVGVNGEQTAVVEAESFEEPQKEKSMSKRRERSMSKPRERSKSKSLPPNLEDPASRTSEDNGAGEKALEDTDGWPESKTNAAPPHLICLQMRMLIAVLSPQTTSVKASLLARSTPCTIGWSVW